MQVLRLVSNMSDIGRYTGFARKDLQDVDCLLRELTEKASGLIGDGASLSYEGPGTPLLAPVDREQLDRALWNILSNCLKFNDKGIRIRISLARHGNMLHITVRDNGTGIAQDVRSTLFQRYLRQPSIEDYRYGLGLGLSMVRTVAANHGGTLLVCEEEGGGTRITLTLAISQEKDPVLRSPIIRPDYSGGFDHGRIELSESLDPRLYEKL
jgi:signal transduction histidine kinase